MVRSLLPFLIVLIARGPVVSYAQGEHRDEFEVPVTPTPGPQYLIQKGRGSSLSRTGQEGMDPESLEKHREFLKRHYAEQGVNYDPGATGIEEELSPSEMEQRYGPPAEYYEPPPGEKVTGCLYTVGVSLPDVCFGDDGQEIFNEARDGQFPGNDRTVAEQTALP